MKSDVSDVGSHVIIYTNNIRQGLNRKTPVTTAYHFQKRHSKQGQSLEAAQGLARGKYNIILSSLLFNKM